MWVDILVYGTLGLIVALCVAAFVSAVSDPGDLL